jgi:hypothetical protein
MLTEDVIKEIDSEPLRIGEELEVVGGRKSKRVSKIQRLKKKRS